MLTDESFTVEELLRAVGQDPSLSIPALSKTLKSSIAINYRAINPLIRLDYLYFYPFRNSTSSLVSSALRVNISQYLRLCPPSY